jgi:glycosyltransferase involved in cell wall biosynthesis
MRILITSPTYPPFNSGLGNAAAQQAAGLAHAGHEVVVATGGGQRSTRQENGIRVETFALTGADYWLRPIRGDVALYTEFLIRHDWDAVLLNAWQNWATDLALRNLELISGRRFVYSHCVSTNVFYPHQPLRSLMRYIAWRPYWWRLSRVMKKLDGVLFLAERGSDSRFDDLCLARQLAVPLRVIPNSLSPTAITVLDTSIRPPELRDSIIAVGSYHWQKGFDFVIRAYAASKVRHRFPLHLYGQAHTSYIDRLHMLVRRLGLPKDSVVFFEGVSGKALMDAYQQARLVLSGSHTECQPLALLDANAAGTPFIARATGCIEDMSGGVSVHSWKEMTIQLDALMDCGPLWASLAAAGLQAAKSIHHPDRIAQQLQEALMLMGPVEGRHV